MRSVLESPVAPDQLARTTRLVEQIYGLHETGQPYQHLRAELGQLVGHDVTALDVHSAFGSVTPQEFAHSILARSVTIPSDLSHSEMLELFQCLVDPSEGELRTSFWLACLRENTGNSRISDLIYWPGEYFGDGDDSRELTPQEALRIAIADGRGGVA
jgi:hypothetical protein